MTLIGFLMLACAIGLVVSLFGVYALSVSAIKVRILALLAISENYVLFKVSINVLRLICNETDYPTDCLPSGADSYPSLYTKPALC